MAAEHDDTGLLHDTIAHALAIADDRRSHLIAALLAQCLDELERTQSPDA